MLHQLWLHGNTRKSCTKSVFLVEIGRVSELAALLTFPFSENLTACYEAPCLADAIIASSMSRSRKSCYPEVDRDVISSSIGSAISTSLIQSIVIWGTAVRRQTTVLKLTFLPFRKSEISDNPSYHIENKFHQCDSAVHFYFWKRVGIDVLHDSLFISLSLFSLLFR